MILLLTLIFSQAVMASDGSIQTLAGIMIELVLFDITLIGVALSNVYPEAKNTLHYHK